MDEKQRTLLVRGSTVFAAVLGALLAVGTFMDYQVAQAVYAPDNPVIIFISTLGLLPLAYPACLMLGVLGQRSLAGNKTKVLAILGAVVCVVLAMLFGALITKSLLSIRDGFGGLAGSELPTTIRLAIGAVIGVILYGVGYQAGKANDAKDLARRLIAVIAVLAGSFVIVELVKHGMSRPRPYLVFAGYEGIGFCPWYSQFSGAGDFMDLYGIDKDAFKSFPSGHSLQAASLLAGWYGLSLVYSGMRSKLGVVLGVGIVFALVVMSCRMILGAHFLSDVSMGALVAVAAFLVIMGIEKRDTRKALDTRQDGETAEE